MGRLIPVKNSKSKTSGKVVEAVTVVTNSAEKDDNILAVEEESPNDDEEEKEQKAIEEDEGDDDSGDDNDDDGAIEEEKGGNEAEEMEVVSPAKGEPLARPRATKTLMKPSFNSRRKSQKPVKSSSSLSTGYVSKAKRLGCAFSMKDFKRLKMPVYQVTRNPNGSVKRQFSQKYRYEHSAKKLQTASGNEYAWSKGGFVRLVKEIAQDFKTDLRFTDGAMAALNEEAHTTMGTILERAVYFACDSGRITIMKRDLYRATLTVGVSCLYDVGMQRLNFNGANIKSSKKRRTPKRRSEEQASAEDVSERKEEKKSINARTTASQKTQSKRIAGIARN